MVSRLLLLISFCFLGVATLRAQVYEPGLLVRANGDTLRGEIENAFWDAPPTFIRYRAAADSPSLLFQPRQLRAVRLASGRYFRYEALPIDQVADTRLSNLPRGNFTNVQVDSILAEVLVEGPLMLWQVATLGARHFLLRRPGQPVLELSERRYLRELPTGGWTITEGNNYHNQLRLYFSDCPAATNAASTAAYTVPGLMGVVQAYYAACAGQAPAYTWQAPAKAPRRSSFQAGVLVGGRYHLLESASWQLAGTHTDGGVHPFGGLYAELLQPSRTAALYGELSLSGFRNQGAQYMGYDANGKDVYSYFSYRALLATARIGVRFFTQLQHDQQLVFSLGFEHNRVLHPQVTITSGPAVSPVDDDLFYASPTLLPNVGVGWRHQRLTLSLDGQLYHSSTDGAPISSTFFGSNLAARLGVGYRLGRNSDTKATHR